MHLIKNLCVNLLGFLGVYGKSKDTLEARTDLKHMKQRGDLHPEPKEKGSHYLSPTSYTLVTTGINPAGVPYVRVLFLIPGGKVHQKLIQYRV
ncbi:hypothetical protein OsJ_18136 [Oryza sativa Japonica Group]|uniref:Uncharacterized protein n=1 Tax=Oryza sativa subsp. japonica TaxID=39947 RepID=B9FNZ4_ORYSJ|nr:hypothetical protein OsJ_18136 [Oryza sativa Japonica Group]